MPKIAPIFLFTIFLSWDLVDRPHKRIHACINGILWILFALSIVTLSAFTFGYITQLPIRVFLGAFNWTYTALITWNTVFILAFLMMWFKSRNTLLAATFATLTISAAGLLYELPLYPLIQNSEVYWHITYPLLIATKWLSLIFLCWILYKQKWKMSPTFFLAAWSYVLFSVVYALYPFMFFPVWLPRLPAAIMLLTIPTGINPSRKSNYTEWISRLLIKS